MLKTQRSQKVSAQTLTMQEIEDAVRSDICIDLCYPYTVQEKMKFAKFSGNCRDWPQFKMRYEMRCLTVRKVWS